MGYIEQPKAARCRVPVHCNPTKYPGTTGTARGTASLGCHLPEGLFIPGAARG